MFEKDQTWAPGTTILNQRKKTLGIDFLCWNLEKKKFGDQKTR
jgi:hypothetical protein